HRRPSCIIAVRHPALRLAQKAFLQLDGTPLLMRPRPSARHQTLGAGNQLWIISAVRELVTEFVLLVGDDEHVIADALGKACNFGLDCEVSGVGAPRTGDKRPRLLLDDPRSELLRGVTYVRGKLLIGIAAADDQQDAG